MNKTNKLRREFEKEKDRIIKTFMMSRPNKVDIELVKKIMEDDWNNYIKNQNKEIIIRELKMKPHEIVKAWEEGKEIECIIKEGGLDFKDYIGNGKFDFKNWIYRIKKQPAVFNSLVGKRIKKNDMEVYYIITAENSFYYYIGQSLRISKEDLKKNYEIIEG